MLRKKTFPKVTANCPNHNHRKSISFPCAIYSDKVTSSIMNEEKKIIFPIFPLPYSWESGTFGKQESWIATSYIWESFNGKVLIQSCFWYLGNQTHNPCLCRGSKHSHAFLANAVCLFLPKDIITILGNFIL